MTSHKTTFKNHSGEKLFARVDFPTDTQPIAYAVFAHCFTCSGDLLAARNISRALADSGIAVLRFDFTGLGESEGKFEDTSFSSNVEDLISAAEHLAVTHDAPQILVGHSLGGAAVLQAAAAIPSAVAVVTIGAPCEPSHVKKLLGDSAEIISQKGQASVALAGRSFTIKKQFLDDLDESRMGNKIRNLRKALLVCHAPSDQTVGVDNAARIFKEALHPKSFVSLDTADHLLSDSRDSCYVGAVIAAWASRYLEKTPESPSVEEAQVVVRTGRARFRTEIVAGSHHMVADEPESVGGTDRGGTPYDYLLSALGACTGITLRMYADRKKWALDEIVVRLQHSKVHADDCKDCETKEGRVDIIDRNIELVGELDESQRQRLLEIADRCPVHRTLHSEIVVRTDLSTGNQGVHERSSRASPSPSKTDPVLPTTK